MSDATSEEPTESTSIENSQEALPTPDEGAAGLPAAPQVTFRGNTYDLVSLGSLGTAALILFSCVTCNMGYYCLPVIAVILGAVGVLGARQSVDEDRTRLWSWLGIAAGGFILLAMVVCFVLYIGFFVLAAASGGWD